jgi:hypothetical protein
MSSQVLYCRYLYALKNVNKVNSKATVRVALSKQWIPDWAKSRLRSSVRRPPIISLYTQASSLIMSPRPTLYRYQSTPIAHN